MLNKNVRLSGNNQQEVDTYLEQLTQAQQAELVAVQAELAARRGELTSLENERDQLDLERQRRLPGIRLLCLAMERLDVTQQAFQHSVDAQIGEHRRAVEAERLSQEQHCAELDEQMIKLQQQINEMLQGVVQVTGGLPEPEPEPDPEPKPEPETEPEEPETEPEFELARTDQDGTTEELPSDDELMIQKADDGEQNEASDEFWDKEYEQAIDAASPLATVADPALEEPAVQPLAQPTERQEHERPTRPQSSGSPAVAGEIRQVRHRYIVGKIAGSELLDDKGGLIVAKDAVITPAVVERAEQAGKLPELIVNMTLPGMDE